MGLAYQIFSDCDVDFVQEVPSVTVISTFELPDYEDAIEAVLLNGMDILFLHCSERLSHGRIVADLAFIGLHDQYPQRKMVCVDTCNISLGAGLLIQEAAKLQADGMELDELAQWVIHHRERISCLILPGSLAELRRGGHISSTDAFILSLLSTRPVLALDQYGSIVPVARSRNKKTAISFLVSHLSKLDPQNIVIGYNDSLWNAVALKEQVAAVYPKNEITIRQTNGVFSKLTGSETLSLFFWK